MKLDETQFGDNNWLNTHFTIRKGDNAVRVSFEEYLDSQIQLDETAQHNFGILLG